MCSIMFAHGSHCSHKRPGEPDLDQSQDPFGPRIRCPFYGWSPGKHDRWFCECGNEWNTFDTGGGCPACLHPCTETQCVSCGRWSPTRIGITIREFRRGA